jgi:hypothetical protein
MQLSLADLDPGLVRRIQKNERAMRIVAPSPPPLRRSNAPSSPAAPRVTAGRVVQGILLVPLLWFLAACIGVVIAGVLDAEDAGAAVMLLLAGVSPLVALNWVFNGWGLPGSRVTQDSASAAALTSDTAALRAPLSRHILESVFESVVLVGAQAAYARCVLLMLELVERKRMDERQARDLLTQLNALVASDQELQAQSESMAQVYEPAAAGRLEVEKAEIEARLSATRDAVARQALERSRELLETRLADHDSLALLGERIEAQREAIEQTLGSLESSLTRLKFSSVPAETLNLTRLQEAASAFNREARSVEQAIHEVARL